MNILERINQLRNERGWSINRLASESMLTQSTVSNIFVNNREPKLNTLRAICGAFDMTLAEFFYENHELVSISPAEQEFLTEFRKLSKNEKELLIGFLTEINHREKH